MDQLPTSMEQASLASESSSPTAAQSSSSSQLNNLYKTQLCKHFQQTKQCHVGKRCHFAHGESELRKRDEPLPLEVTLRLMNIPYNNYKTQTCKNFEKEGKCKFADKCSYAHGSTDLRNPYDTFINSNGLASGAPINAAALAQKATTVQSNNLSNNNQEPNKQQQKLQQTQSLPSKNSSQSLLQLSAQAPPSSIQNSKNLIPSSNQQFANQLQQINNYVIPGQTSQSGSMILGQSLSPPPHSRGLQNGLVINPGMSYNNHLLAMQHQRGHANSMSPTNMQRMQGLAPKSNGGQGLIIQPQKMALIQGNPNGMSHNQQMFYGAQQQVQPQIMQAQRHMSDHILIHNHFAAPQMQPHVNHLQSQQLTHQNMMMQQQQQHHAMMGSALGAAPLTISTSHSIPQMHSFSSSPSHHMIVNGGINNNSSPNNHLLYAQQQSLIHQQQQMHSHQQSQSLSPRKMQVLPQNHQPINFTSVGNTASALHNLHEYSTTSSSSPTHMDSLRSKSMSLDNAFFGSWGAQTSASSSQLNIEPVSSLQTGPLNTKSSSNNNIGGLNSSSFNTAFGGSSGGFNYMLINPALYDEEPIADDSHFDDAYSLHQAQANAVISLSSSTAF